SSHIGRVLTYSSSEHKRINSAQHDSHATNGCSQAMHKNIECQFRSLVTSLTLCQDFTHIARQARDSKQTRLLIQQMVHLLAIKLTLTHQIDQNPRIDSARTRSHH